VSLGNIKSIAPVVVCDIGFEKNIPAEVVSFVTAGLNAAFPIPLKALAPPAIVIISSGVTGITPPPYNISPSLVYSCVGSCLFKFKFACEINPVPELPLSIPINTSDSSTILC